MERQVLAPADAQFITANGVTTVVERPNPTATQSIILIHGFEGATTNWHPVLSLLADAGYDVIAFDLKGFGLSDKRFREDYSHVAQAEFVAAVMDQLSVDRAVIVGHSMGGSVTAHFAQQFPERVDGLIFVDGGAFQLEGEGDSTGLAQLVRFPPIRRVARHILLRTQSLEENYQRWQRTFANRGLYTMELYEANFLARKTADWDVALLAILRDGGDNGLPEPLDTSGTPTLIVWGAEDRWSRLWRGQWYAEQLVGSELIVIDNAGHLPMLERPSAFTNATLPFLQSLNE